MIFFYKKKRILKFELIYFKFVYGHAEAFITELRIEHSLQSNCVHFQCDPKLGQALYTRA